MKKPSFFERLAGNLRFNDVEEENDTITPEPKREEKRLPERRELPEHREIPVNNSQQQAQQRAVNTPPSAPVIEEEIGELPVDVYETPNEIIIQTLIAGVLPENLSIGITRDTVTLSGKREENKGISHESYQIQELYWGAFERTVHLTEEIEIDTSEAIERHGMLMIKLPKLDKRRKTVLKVKSI